MAILNLDVFEEKIEEIVLKGVTYKIPSDIPTILYLRLLRATEKSAAEGMQEGMDVVYEIFKIHQPKLGYDEFSKSITNDKYTAIINFIFAGMDVEETRKQLADIKEQIKNGKKKPLPAEN